MIYINQTMGGVKMYMHDNILNLSLFSSFLNSIFDLLDTHVHTCAHMNKGIPAYRVNNHASFQAT